MNDAERLKKIMAANLRKQLEKTGKNQTDISVDLNIPLMTVSNWLNAKTYPRIDKIQLLADYFRISRADLTEEVPSNLTPISPATVKIPVLGKIACGDPIDADENFSGYRYRSPDGLPGGKLYILEAVGDSMLPTIPPGAEVTIREQPQVESSEIAAVLVNGDEQATLKRIRWQGNTMMLMPDNRDYEPIIVSEDYPVKIIGKAVEVVVKL